MTEILLGAVIFLLAQGYKKIDTKYGDEVSKNVLLLLAFFFSVLLAAVTAIYNGTFDATTSKALITTAIQIFSSAIVMYETIYKRFIVPVLNFGKKVI